MDKTSWEHPGPCLGPLGPWQPSTRRERTSGATQPHLGMLSVHHPHPMDPSRFWSVSQNLHVVLVTCCYMLSIFLSPDACRCMYSETYINLRHQSTCAIHRRSEACFLSCHHTLRFHPQKLYVWASVHLLQSALDGWLSHRKVWTQIGIISPFLEIIDIQISSWITIYIYSILYMLK